MFAFLFEPEIDDPAHCFGGIAKVLGVAGNERCRTVAVAKLKLLDGRPQFSDEVRAQLRRQVPFGFGAIAAISEEVPDPFGGVERFHRAIYFVLQSMTSARDKMFNHLVNIAGLGAQRVSKICHTLQ